MKMKEAEVKDKYPNVSHIILIQIESAYYQDNWNIFLTCIISNLMIFSSIYEKRNLRRKVEKALISMTSQI